MEIASPAERSRVDGDVLSHMKCFRALEFLSSPEAPVMQGTSHNLSPSLTLFEGMILQLPPEFLKEAQAIVEEPS